MKTAQLTVKGQVTLPQELRLRFNLGADRLAQQLMGRHSL